MHNHVTGLVAREITDRLTRALNPTQLQVINDSARHAGHSGDDGTGESHFTIIVESAALAGASRIERQRIVLRALGKDLVARIHALSIKATAPEPVA